MHQRCGTRSSLYGEAAEELVERIFNTASSEFCACNFEGRSLVELTVRLVYPLPRLFTIVPNVLRMSEHTGESFRPLAFVEREALCATLPSRLRYYLELVCARGASRDDSLSSDRFGRPAETADSSSLTVRTEAPRPRISAIEWGFNHAAPRTHYSSLFRSNELSRCAARSIRSEVNR